MWFFRSTWWSWVEHVIDPPLCHCLAGEILNLLDDHARLAVSAARQHELSEITAKVAACRRCPLVSRPYRASARRCTRIRRQWRRWSAGGTPAYGGLVEGPGTVCRGADGGSSGGSKVTGGGCCGGTESCRPMQITVQLGPSGASEWDGHIGG